MTETQKVNSVLREIFGLPLTAEQRLTLFFTWGLFEPLDPNGERKGRQRLYNTAFYLENAEQLKERVRKHREENVEAFREYDKRRYNEDELRRVEMIDRAAAAAANNPEKTKEQKRRSAEQPINKAKKHARVKERRANEPLFRLLGNLRGRVAHAMKSAKKAAGTRALLDMELSEFRIFIQGQFKPGMTWDNYGKVWELDHVKPCALFDLSDIEQQRQCFHWSNHQPLFVEENRRKGDNFPS